MLTGPYDRSPAPSRVGNEAAAEVVAPPTQLPLTLHAGAALVAPFVRYTDVHAYVAGATDRFVKALDLCPLETGGGVHLLTTNIDNGSNPCLLNSASVPGACPPKARVRSAILSDEIVELLVLRLEELVEIVDYLAGRDCRNYESRLPRSPFFGNPRRLIYCCRETSHEMSSPNRRRGDEQA